MRFWEGDSRLISLEKTTALKNTKIQVELDGWLAGSDDFPCTMLRLQALFFREVYAFSFWHKVFGSFDGEAHPSLHF